MSENIKITAARREQSKASKSATLEQLKGKKPRRKTIKVVIEDNEVELTFQAISSTDLDKLQGKHTPTMDQKAKGFAFNPQTFAPALVAACSYEPKMTEEDTKEIWESEAWSTGELNVLFDTCSVLCMEGMTIPFSSNG